MLNRSIQSMLLVILVAGPLLADEMVTFTLGNGDAALTTEQDHQGIILRDGVCQSIPGAPLMPELPRHVLLPPDREATGIEVIAAVPETIKLCAPLPPCPQVQTIGNGTQKAPDNASDAAIYLSEGPYPGALARITGQGAVGTYRFASLAIAPLQYLPARNIVLRYRTITVRVVTGPTSNPTAMTGGGDPAFERLAAKLAANPGALRYYRSAAQDRAQPGPPRIAAVGADDPFPYLIITSQRLESAFAPLAQWKTRKGVRARIFTTEWICQRYSGIDPAERVRAFIKQARQRWGVSWVLLAGGVDDVPHRVAAGYPGDLYFSDLGGDWNFNRNATWGETADSVDLYPDVFVGRLPVSDTAAAANLVAKIICYEQAAVADYQTKLLFIGADLDNQTHTGEVKDSIAAQNVAPYSDLRVDRLYPSTPTVLNRANVLAALNAGYNLINFSDHADYYSMGTGSRTGGGQLTLADAAGLANAGRPGLLYTIGCYDAAFDKSCIGGQFLTAANGAAAVIGCSRDAWFITGQPYASTSYLFDRSFFKALLTDSCFNLGAALGLAKARLVPSSQDGLMRWSQYEINLLGDPELAVWTDSVRSLALEMPDSLMTGAGSFTIVARDSATGQPLCGARLCLWQASGDAYAVATTDAAGAATFSYDPPDTGALGVTATAHNYRPRSGGIRVVTLAQPHIVIVRYRIIDSLGNRDSVANPGEGFALSLLVRNTGAAAAESVRVQLACSDTMIAPGAAAALLPVPLAAGDSAWCAASPAFAVTPACPDGRRIKMDAAVLFPASNADSVIVRIDADSLALEHFAMAEVAGDGDGVADSGETIELQRVRIGNYGSGRADGVRLSLAPISAGVSMIADSAAIDSIPANGATDAAIAFRFIPAVPGPDLFRLAIHDRAGRQWHRDIAIKRRPAAPGGVGVATDRTGLRVTWEASAGAAGYAVYRSPADSADYAEISEHLIKDCLYFTDVQAASGVAYAYTLAASDTSGCLSIASAIAAGSPAPGIVPGWPQQLGVYSGWNWNAPVAGDLNGDGRRDVVMANPNGMIYAWDADGRALPGWPRQFGTGIGAPLALADLDKDQQLEALIAYNDTLTAVRADGSVLPGWPYPAGAAVLAAAVSDIDRDGRLEVIASCADNTVRALRWNGSAVTVGWSWAMPVGTAPKLSIGDVRGTSLPEIVVTSWANAGTRSYVLDNQGTALDSLLSPATGDNNVPAAALLADLDGDARDEVIIPYLTGGAVCAWDGTGQLLWRAAPGIIWSTPAAFTMAGDSLPRIAAAAMNGNVIQLDRNGAAIPGWPVFWQAMHASPLAADLGGDGNSDLVVRGDYGMIQSLDGSGQALPGFPVTTADGNYSPATITRLAPGPGCDLLADTRGCQVFRWQLDASPAQPPDWPMQGHDIFRTSRHGALIDWCGHISRSLAISGDNFMNGDVVVDSGATLTVLPGSRLFFSDRRDFENLGVDPLRAELIVRGRLVIDGRPDDSVHCDTWSNAPCDSSWHGIRIEPGGQAAIGNCAVMHSLHGLYYGVEARLKPGIPGNAFNMGQCRPNPAAAAITIDFELPAAARVVIGVYNVAGQRLQTLSDGLLAAGPHRVTWDGTNRDGATAANGVYLIRLQGGGFSAVRKAVRVR